MQELETRRMSVVIVSSVVLVVSCAPPPTEPEPGVVAAALADCGPAPHHIEVDGECLPSCGVAGGDVCSDQPRTDWFMVDRGRTWDCAYCYDSLFLGNR
jgi:hypothetical protein